MLAGRRTETRDAAGRTVASRLTMPEPYALTATVAIEILHRVAAGEDVAGSRTPATVFGADFIMRTEGVIRQDL